MPFYKCEIGEADGGTAVRVIEAEDTLALEKIVQAKGDVLVRILGEARSRIDSGSGRVSRSEVVEMAYHLSVTTASGLSVVEALEDFAERRAGKAFSKILRAVVEDVRSGRLLSEAMRDYPAVFDPLLVTMVEAGEASGAMGEVMGRYASEMEWQQRVRGKVSHAFSYPAVLLVALSGLVVLLLTFLLPRILALMPEGEVSLPVPTRILMVLSSTLERYWPYLFGFLAAGAIGFKFASKRPSVALWLDRVKMSLPWFGKLARDAAAARFVSTFRTLLEAGVETTEAMQMAGRASGSILVQKHIDDAIDMVISGALLSEALGSVREFDPLVAGLINLGEQTGETVEALGRAVAYFNASLPRRVKRVVAVIEPAIIVIAGAVTAFVLLGAILPVFTLYASL